MAASVVKHCVNAAVKFNCLPTTIAARRWLLSSAYTHTELWEARAKDPQNLALLAASMNTTFERNFPVSSLTVSQFVDNISSKEEVGQAEYYLYKFRHSPNCWYLREWTVHSWIRKCLKFGAKDKALYTLQNKVQYGIFPDDFAFNLLLDSFLKDKDFKGACSVVEEVMLQEAFDLPSTQMLCLYALGSYLATTPPLTESEEHGLGASLLLCGMKQKNTLGLSAQLIGNALLGKREILMGIHAVFREMPLSWERGYLDRALAIMDRVAAAPADVKVSKEALDSLGKVLQELSSDSQSESSDEEPAGEKDENVIVVEEMDEEDAEERAKLPQYASRFTELRSKLESLGKVDDASLQALASTLAQQNLAAAEQSDLQSYELKVQEWESERKQLVLREREMRAKAEKEREERLAARAAAQAAAQ